MLIITIAIFLFLYLQLLAGLNEPTAGSILIQRYSVSGDPKGPPEPLASSKVGILFQFPERYHPPKLNDRGKTVLEIEAFILDVVWLESADNHFSNNRCVAIWSSERKLCCSCNLGTSLLIMCLMRSHLDGRDKEVLFKLMNSLLWSWRELSIGYACSFQVDAALSFFIYRVLLSFSLFES